MYSLRGDEEADAFTRAEEQFMMSTIVDTIMQDKDLEKHHWLGALREMVKQVKHKMSFKLL